MSGTHRMFPSPNISTLKPTRKVACVALVWKCFSSGTMATVKLDLLRDGLAGARVDLQDLYPSACSPIDVGDEGEEADGGVGRDLGEG